MAKIKDQKYYSYLAARIREGNSDAFTELYEQTHDDLYRYAYYFLKNPNIIPDVLQEVYISVFKNIKTLKLDRLLLPWMRQIAYHICCDYARQMREERMVPTDFTDDTWGAAQAANMEDKPDDFQEVYDRDASRHLNAALQKLPYNERQAFLLRYENGLKLEQVADFMGVSLASVKRYIQRARESLQVDLAHLRETV